MLAALQTAAACDFFFPPGRCPEKKKACGDCLECGEHRRFGFSLFESAVGRWKKSKTGDESSHSGAAAIPRPQQQSRRPAVPSIPGLAVRPPRVLSSLGTSPTLPVSVSPMD